MAETEFTLVRTGGSQTTLYKLYEGVHPLLPVDIAETLYWLANLPPHVNIDRLEMMPTNQSFGLFKIYRDTH